MPSATSNFRDSMSLARGELTPLRLIAHPHPLSPALGWDTPPSAYFFTTLRKVVNIYAIATSPTGNVLERWQHAHA
ncbi:hypothetical protein VDGL01_09838 [Verticillium dahliae]